jgi:putative flippase GtrA
MKTKEGERLIASSPGTTETFARRFQAWRSTCWQFLRYCLVGGANTAIDLLTINILLWGFPTNNVLVLVLYNSVAYCSGALSSFFLNKYWTFRYKRKTTRREVIRFIVTLLLEVLYSNALIWLAGKILQPLITNPALWGNASKLVAIAGSTLLSYSFMRFWTFASASHGHSKKQEETAQQSPNDTLDSTSHPHPSPEECG